MTARERTQDRTPWIVRGGILLATAIGFAAPTWSGGAIVERLVVVDDVSESVVSVAGPPPDDDVFERLEVADGVRSSASASDSTGALPRGRSRLGDGLAAAAEWLGGPPGAIRLRTDGRDTEGDVVRVAQALAAQGHRVFVEGPTPTPADVALDSVRVVSVSGDPRIGDMRVEVAVALAASVSGRVRVALVRDGAERDAKSIDVSAAAPSTLRLVDPAGPRSSDVYEVRLVPLDGTPDDDRVNDRVRFERPSFTPRVTIVGLAPSPSVVDRGVRIARVGSMDDVAFDETDLLVLSNQPWRALRGETFLAIERFVAGGGSLAVLGGEDAYGHGGVAGTPYERLLALRPRKDDGDSVACVVALDRSGSTGEATGGSTAPIDDLKRAVRALVRALPARTQLTVLPFADAPDGLIPDAGPLRSGDEGAWPAFLARLDAVTPAGGTDLGRAIEGGVRAATSVSDVRRRRLFLLTDGDPDHSVTAESLAPLRKRLAGAGVEFAAIVRGDEAAAVALRALSARPSDVVRIERSGDFPESLLRTFDRGASPDELVQGPFTSALAVDAVGGHLGSIAALHLTRIHRLDPAPDAVVWVRSTASDATSYPLAAVRRHGAGRVACLAAGPALEPDVARERMVVELFDVLDELARAADRGVAADRVGDRLTVESVAGLASVSVLVGDALDPVTLLETTNGVYEGELPSGTPIDAVLRLDFRGDAPRALRLPYAPPIEHRGAGADGATLRAIAAAGNGSVLGPLDRTPRRRTSTHVDLSPYGFAMAVLLLVVERVRSRGRARATVTS